MLFFDREKLETTLNYMEKNIRNEGQDKDQSGLENTRVVPFSYPFCTVIFFPGVCLTVFICYVVVTPLKETFCQYFISKTNKRETHEN